MVRSMTGFGAAQATGSRVAVEAEIRSVNARSLKLNVRGPSILAAREPDLELLVRRYVRRGSLTIQLRLKYLRPQDVLKVRDEVVEGFARALDRLRKRGLVDGAVTPEALAALHGAVESGTDEPLRPADFKVVRRAVTGALEALDAMRGREAGHLARDLHAIVKRMRRTLEAVRRRAPAVVSEQQRRLKDRVDGLLAASGTALDEATLAREVALFADRCDVTEEVTRLAAHLDEFEKLLERDGEVGRTLEFLSQELLREANTIGSKSQDVRIARAVIALKTDVDRLKEQVANLE